jgi:hypothetical protein
MCLWARTRSVASSFHLCSTGQYIGISFEESCTFKVLCWTGADVTHESRRTSVWWRKCWCLINSSRWHHPLTPHLMCDNVKEICDGGRLLLLCLRTNVRTLVRFLDRGAFATRRERWSVCLKAALRVCLVARITWNSLSQLRYLTSYKLAWEFVVCLVACMCWEKIDLVVCLVARMGSDWPIN